MRGRRTAIAPVAAAVVLGLTVSVPVAARADRHDRSDRPAVPSRAQVEGAQADAQDAADLVARIQAELALANAELEASAVQAAQAFEGYNGARWAAEEAAREVEQAVAAARRADRELVDQRDELARLVAVTYQDGGELTAIDAVLGASGPTGVMDQLLSYEGVSSSMDARLQRFTATADLAEVFRSEAEEAREQKLRLLDEAEEAKDTAAAAAEVAQALAESITARKTQLVAELAELQGVSVELAERRQSALEDLERERAAQEAAEQAAQETRPEIEPEHGPEPESETEHQTEPRPGAQRPETEAAPAPVPVVPPTDSTPPAPTGGASAAIAFARSQLGDPYVWGAAGPGSWDCSGLTMGAWEAGGVSLPHYSVAQYDATTPIGAGSLRPGDLVFWGSTDSPGSIFHVALYAGEGMIIHAPRTGRPVTLDSMYYWVPPNFFGRV